jgi:uncharacterized protein YjbI with pentapeptide repeats
MAGITGKSFWLDRKVRLWTRSQLGTLIVARGGSVADEIAPGVGYVVLDPVRRTAGGQSDPEQQAASAGATVLYLDDLHTLLCPSRDEALELLRGGPANAERWAAVLPLAASTAEIDLTGADLTGLDLSGFTFRRCNLAGATLAGVTFDGATFVGTHDGDFRKAGSLRGVTISSARRCDFDGLDLTGVKLDGRFEECTFRRTLLCDAEAASVEFVDCIATEGDWTGANFSGCVATKLNALTLHCCKTQLAHANFTGSHLGGTDFTDAVLEEAVFEGAHMEQTTFSQANLYKANFTSADLENADFRNANLAEADFTSAKTTGADFGNANIRGAKLVRNTSAVRKRPTTTVPAVPATPAQSTVQSHLTELRDALAQAPNWVLSFALVTQAHGLQRWTIETIGKGRFRTSCETRGENIQAQTADWVQALIDLHATNPTATPQADTVRVLPRALGTSLKLLPCQAICELFILAIPQTEPVAVSLLTALTGGIEAFFRKGEESLRLWNLATEMERRALADCQNANLAGMSLPGLEFSKLNATGANFEKANLATAQFREANLRHAHLRGAKLKEANLGNSDCRGADAEKADLSQAVLTGSDWRGANLKRANLKKADVKGVRFQAADLTDAILDGVVAGNTQYDDSTLFPDGFKPGQGWVSTSGDPNEGVENFDALMGALAGLIGHNRSSPLYALNNAHVVPLWSEGDEDGVRGVVPESAKSTTFRACRLTSAGAHECCKQDFTLCTDAGKGMCQHVLVLLLDLARRERIALADALRWARLSLAHDRSADPEILARVFASYAESTQTDYRPNETLPEDYYAL